MIRKNSNSKAGFRKTCCNKIFFCFITDFRESPGLIKEAIYDRTKSAFL